MKLLFTSLLILCSTVTLFAKHVEVDTFLVNKELEINTQLKKLRSIKDDNLRYLENESLKGLVESVLAYPGTFEYPFSSFETMSTIASPDGAFRLFNWNIEDNSGVNSHYCYMILPGRGGKPNQIITFKEDHVTIPPRPENTLMPTNWYGALYYNIIPIKKGSKTYYTVIGYNGGSRNTNKKILDVFYFKAKKLKLGYPLFQEEAGSKRLLRRVFFEYSETATIGVNMNDQLDAIVFDHLVPESENLVGMYDFYIPDMTYDAYRWDGRVWRYEEDKVAVNSANRKSRLYDPRTAGADNDGEEFVEVNDEWIDPVDGNPNGGGTNAVAPVEESESGNKKKKRVKSKDKRTRRGWFKRKPKKPHSAISQ